MNASVLVCRGKARGNASKIYQPKSSRPRSRPRTWQVRYSARTTAPACCALTSIPYRSLSPPSRVALAPSPSIENRARFNTSMKATCSLAIERA